MPSEDENKVEGGLEEAPDEATEEVNKYFLQDFNEDDVPPQMIQFYKLNIEGSHENGTTLEEMLRVSFERLTDLNNRFPCEENVSALSHIGSAIEFLNKRTEERKARRVEGTHQL